MLFWVQSRLKKCFPNYHWGVYFYRVAWCSLVLEHRSLYMALFILWIFEFIQGVCRDTFSSMPNHAGWVESSLGCFMTDVLNVSDLSQRYSSWSNLHVLTPLAIGETVILYNFALFFLISHEFSTLTPLTSIIITYAHCWTPFPVPFSY